MREAAFPCRFGYGPIGRLGSLEPIRTVELPGALGDGANGEAVPIDEDLVVATGPDPVLSFQAKLFEERRKVQAFLAAWMRVTGATKDRVPFPGGRGCQGIDTKEGIGFVAERRLDLLASPGIEFPLLAVAVGIETGCEGAALHAHFAQQPGDRIFDSVLKRPFGRSAIRPAASHQELGIIVKHLLEMRD